MATQPGWATDEPEEILAIARAKAPKVNSTYRYAAPGAGRPNWAGKYAPRVGRKCAVKDLYARPTVAQVRYYRMLGGTGDVDGMYRGEISTAIDVLKGDGALTASQEWRKARNQATGRRRSQKRASVSRFFLGGKKGFRS